MGKVFWIWLMDCVDNFHGRSADMGEEGGRRCAWKGGGEQRGILMWMVGYRNEEEYFSDI